VKFKGILFLLIFVFAAIPSFTQAAPGKLTSCDLNSDVNPFGIHDSELSSWQYHWARSQSKNLFRKKPSTKKLGAYGIGNGRVFSVAGTRFPLNTLRATLGPGFGTPNAYFGDMRLRLLEGRLSIPLRFVKESIGHIRRAPIVRTVSHLRSKLPWSKKDVVFSTWTWALPDKPVIMRLITVKNCGSRSVKKLRLEGFHKGGLEKAGDLIWQARGGANMIIVPGTMLGADSDHAGQPIQIESIFKKRKPKRWKINIPDLEPGQVWSTSIALLFTERTAKTEQTAKKERSAWLARRAAEMIQELQSRTLAEWFDETVQYWHSWYEEGVQIEVVQSNGSQKIQDLFDEALLAVKLQQENLGGVSSLVIPKKGKMPGVKVRETLGPIRYFLSTGHTDDALLMADYLYGAALSTEKYSTSYSFSLKRGESQDPGLDGWRERPFFESINAVAVPSELVLHLDRYWRWTGNVEPFSQRYDFLKWAIQGQLTQRKRDGLLPFAGDELWRKLLPWTDIGSTWKHIWKKRKRFRSVESHYLLGSASRAMARVARYLGKAGDAADFARIASENRMAVELNFRKEPNYYFSPYVIEKRKSGYRYPKWPITSVGLMAQWSGFLDPQDKEDWVEARLNLLSIVGILDRRWDQIPSTPHLLGKWADRYLGVEPGLLLWDLAELEHPFSESAFNHILKTASSSGGYSSLYRSRNHAPVNKTKLRPAEGAINLEAAFSYLTGVRPDFQGREFVSIRPHLINGVNRVSAQGIRMGGGTLSIVFSRQPGKLSLTVTPENLTGVSVDLSLPLPLDLEDAVILEVRKNGIPEPFRVDTPWGAHRVIQFEESVQLSSEPILFELIYEKN